MLSPSQSPRQPLRRRDNNDKRVFPWSGAGFLCDISFALRVLNGPHASFFAASPPDVATRRTGRQPAALLRGVSQAERRENKRLLSPPDATPSSRAPEGRASLVFCAAPGVFRAVQGSTLVATLGTRAAL